MRSDLVDRRRLRLSQVENSLRFSMHSETATCSAGDVRPPSPLRAKSQRLRRRGPRSQGARIRRSRTRIGEIPPAASGESLARIEEEVSNNAEESVLLSINARGLLARIAMVHAYLSACHADVVGFQETWLDDSVLDLIIPGYILISRKDRLIGPKAGYGGIALYAREEVASSISLLEHSAVAERSWHVLQTTIGPILVCNWYRPPDAPLEHILSFRTELERLSNDYIGILCVGDHNIHHKKWLRFSNKNSREGEELKTICDEFSLLQEVKGPTRENHLLDLVMTDLSACLCVDILPKLADHNVTRSRLTLHVESAPEVSRTVWQFSKANWTNLKQALRDTDWNAQLSGDIDQAVERVVNQIKHLAEVHIPRQTGKNVFQRILGSMIGACKLSMSKSAQRVQQNSTKREEIAILLLKRSIMRTLRLSGRKSVS